MRMKTENKRVRALKRIGLRFILILSLTMSPAYTVASSKTPFRIGFAETMFSQVNGNDARAAMKVWGQTVAREQGLPVEPEPVFFKDTAGMLQALQNQAVDAVSVSTIEYDVLRRKVAFEQHFFTIHRQKPSEEYLLIAHRQSPVKRLEDLSGRDVRIIEHFRTGLAPLWLDTLLNQRGLPPVETFTRQVTGHSQLSQVLLSVFFRKADACVVTRSGFETMSELNPQIGQHLIILESSGDLIPAVFAFRKNYSAPYKEALLDALSSLHQTPAGKQVLLVFSAEKLEEHSENALHPALELIAAHAKLPRKSNEP